MYLQSFAMSHVPVQVETLWTATCNVLDEVQKEIYRSWFDKRWRHKKCFKINIFAEYRCLIKKKN